MSARLKQFAEPFAVGNRANVMRTVLTLLTAVAASGAAAFLIESDHISRVEIVLFAAVLIVGILFGVVYGLVALAAALVFRTVTGASLFPFALATHDAILLVCLGVGVALVGLSLDSALRLAWRRRAKAPDLGPAASARRSAPDFVRDDALMPRLVARGASFWKLLKRALAFVAVLAAGVVAGWIAGRYVGPTSQLPIMLSAVTACGALYGAGLGLTAGVMALLAVQVLGGLPTLPLFSLGMGLQLVVFAVVGWSVGRLCDESRRQSERLSGIVGATRDLSSNADEAAVRQVLLDRLSGLTSVSRAELRDEAGVIIAARAPTPESADAAHPWRLRRLVADGRDVGEARWSPATDGASAADDNLICSIIDLGAAAIVRARLNAEKAEMEFVTRTEHLRTILLDAVSHHFRSPLAGILGSVTSVLSLPDQHDRNLRRELLLIIKEQANRLNRYVDNFLSVARLESGSIDVNRRSLSLEALIYDVWETFGEAGGSRRFLRVKMDPQPVLMDEALMTQVLGNLLENAIKFSAEGSVIDVVGVWQDDELRIDVIDEGCGVPEASLDRMFDRFYRSPGAKSPGLGLGLYITRSLVEILGGRVQAHNRLEGQTGLAVTFYLPAQRGSP